MSEQPGDGQVPAYFSIDIGAAGHHEMFTAYIKAGFTRKEALELVKAWIYATFRTQP